MKNEMRVKMLAVVAMFLFGYLASGCGALQYATYPEQVAPLITDGYVEAIHPGGTLAGLRSAANGASGTGILQKGDLIMFYWCQGRNMAFAVLDAGKQQAINSFANLTGGKGNVANFSTFSEFRAYLQQNGWENVGPAALPPAIAQGLQATSSWLTSLAGSMPTFLFVSPVMLTPQVVLEEVEG